MGEVLRVAAPSTCAAVRPCLHCGDIVVAEVDNDFTVKYLHRRAGRVKLVAADPAFPDIVFKDGQTMSVCAS